MAMPSCPTPSHRPAAPQQNLKTLGSGTNSIGSTPRFRTTKSPPEHLQERLATPKRCRCIHRAVSERLPCRHGKALVRITSAAEQTRLLSIQKIQTPFLL